MLIDVTERYSERMLGDVVHRLWNLKQTGLAGDAIGLKIGWIKPAVHRHIREHGGMRPRWGREAIKPEPHQTEESLMLTFLCYLVAAVLFFLATINVPGGRRFSLIPAGLFFAVLPFLYAAAKAVDVLK